ncbi:MAG TPA: NADPH:quinone oxidoreductase family protein [Polyangia bacterium]|jgi:NADPH2:quinone reductase|nr:NADPH:quinone oxidoreductase family protein [Polyangia bacterium]
MRAWVAHGFGPPESLRFEEVADPSLADGQVRIDVKSIGVNFPDVLLVAGGYQVKPTPPFVPGFEVAGTVLESRVGALPVGSRVAAVLGMGGYATQVVAPRDAVWRIPDAMSFDEAAAMTITYQTGWFALHRRAHLQQGETLLVHAGAGGVGSAAIQLGKAAGARVLATAGGADKVALCRTLGADLAVDYKSEDFVGVVKAATSGRGADVIFDPVGGEVLERSTKCIAFEGRILIIGFTSGRAPEIRANHVLVKNYALLGLHWGLYHQLEPASVTRAQEELYRLYVEGRIKPMVSERLPLAEAPGAMARVAGRGTVGKIVLVPSFS